MNISRGRGTPQAKGSAAAVAERLERFCSVAILHRTRGVCVEPGVQRAAHLRRGHDAGCAALGTPRRAVAFTLRLWGNAGIATLLLEAIDEAIAVLIEQGAADPEGEWNDSLARESIVFAIRSRITPRALPIHDRGRDFCKEAAAAVGEG